MEYEAGITCTVCTMPHVHHMPGAAGGVHCAHRTVSTNLHAADQQRHPQCMNAPDEAGFVHWHGAKVVESGRPLPIRTAFHVGMRAAFTFHRPGGAVGTDREGVLSGHTRKMCKHGSKGLHETTGRATFAGPPRNGFDLNKLKRNRQDLKS